MKYCNGCLTDKPLSEFGIRSTKSGDFKPLSRCKICRLEYNKQYQKSDKAKEYSRIWARENREKTREYEKRYWEKNPEKLKEKLARNDKKYRERNPDKVRERAKNWEDRNPDKVKARQKRYRDSHPNKSRDDAIRRRALELGVESVKYTEEDIFAKWGTNCHICGEPIDLDAPRQVGVNGWEMGLHLDHVLAISKGGPDTPANVKPSHGICNLKKN